MMNDIDKRAHELMMSPTMGKLGGLGQSIPLNVRDKENVRTALTTMALPLINALDNQRIKFETDIDAAMLHGLLVVALEIANDGKFSSSFVEVGRH